MLDRNKILEMVNLVLDIQEMGAGTDGFPYAYIEISNFGYPVVCSMMKNGWGENPDNHFDAYYIISDSAEDAKEIDACIDDLKDLLKKAEEMVNV